MHAPISVSGVRRRLTLPRWVWRRPGRPSKPTVIAAACLSGLGVLLGVILVYTPIAHPKTLTVVGVTGSSEARITRLLEQIGSRQSTFAVSHDALMRAVAAYPEVADVEIDSDPPFRLELRAVMRPAVGRLTLAGQTFVVAADGTILKRAADADVPKLDTTVGTLSVRGGRVTGAASVLTVLAAAPEPLLEIARSVDIGHAGIEIEMSHGPRLVFGTADQAADKWAAAAAVIADGSADGATYIDLRVPSRPAVGGLGGSKSAVSTDPPTLTAGASTGSATVGSAAGAAQGVGTASATGGTQLPAATPLATAPPASTATGGSGSASTQSAGTTTQSGASAQPSGAGSGAGAASSTAADGAAQAGGGAAIGAGQ
ncbi:MAG: cell division protein FtsQ/DivIB [Patulibacter sp.]